MCSYQHLSCEATWDFTADLVSEYTISYFGMHVQPVTMQGQLMQPKRFDSDWRVLYGVDCSVLLYVQSVPLF